LVYLVLTILSAVAGYFGHKRQKQGLAKGLFVICIFSLLSFLITVKGTVLDENKKENTAKRNMPGEGDYTKKYYLNSEHIFEDYLFELSVEEQKLNQKEADELFEKAKKEIEQCILGENKSFESVMYDLYLPDTLVDDRVEATYFFDNANIINWDGSICTENVIEKTNPILVTVILNCQTYEKQYGLYINVVPKIQTQKEKIIDEIKKEIQKQNDSETGTTISLPNQISGYLLDWEDKEEKPEISLFLLGLAGGIAVFMAEKNQVKKSEERIQKQLMQDYPLIISKFSLLLGAGMSASLAWERIVFTYLEQRKEGRGNLRRGYEEMIITLNEIRDGVGEMKAYERFGKRTENMAYRKFASLLVQNIRKSSSGMQKLLEDEARDSFERRKNMAKKAGEEAGIKLLMPMMLMLLVILVILMFPAMISMQI